VANEDHDSLIIIRTQVGQIKETVERLDKLLNGNGKAGLCEVITKHKVYFTLIGTALIILAGALIAKICDKI